MEDAPRRPATRTEIEDEIKRLEGEREEYDSSTQVAARHRVRSDALLAADAQIWMHAADVEWLRVSTPETMRWVWSDEALKSDGFSLIQDGKWWIRNVTMTEGERS